MNDATYVERPRIAADDPRYRALIDKRFNKRFVASPDYVRLVHSADEVVSAVQDAVSEGQRLVVTSGGHCLEGFVSDPDVRVIIDVSPMKRVSFDAEMGAVMVEAGATVGETFRTLFENWGVVVPLGAAMARARVSAVGTRAASTARVGQASVSRGDMGTTTMSGSATTALKSAAKAVGAT